MTKKRRKELAKKRLEKERLALVPACGRTGKVRRARKEHVCVGCQKAHKIKPGQVYVAKSVFIRPPRYPILLPYCKKTSLAYAKRPDVMERALMRAAGTAPPMGRNKDGVRDGSYMGKTKVTDFEKMCERWDRAYRWMKDNVWEELRRKREYQRSLKANAKK